MDLHELIEGRFAVSLEEDGRWQVLELDGYEPTPIVIRHDAPTGARLIACPLGDELIEADELRWRATGIRADLLDQISPGEPRPHLVVQTEDERQHSMLNDLVAGLIRAGAREPSEVVTKLRVLQRWWEPPRELSESAAVGLFGELFFLSRWLDDDWSCRVAAWDGANRSLKDFNWPDLSLHVEVKTTQDLDPPPTHIVAGVAQLNVAANHKLALFSTLARCDPGGEESLTALVRQIRENLRGNPVAEQDFVEKLDKVGFHPDLPDYRFIVSASLSRMYGVHGDFPRITPAHFVGQGGLVRMDSRVSIRTYSVRLEGVESYALDVTPPVSPSAIAAALR